jgi:energy-coupling factor transport system substrate-specific component
MSWPVAALILLALALAAGAAWYERTRPPAKVVALVATLGALAALGRVAFAPLPNVKPTSDIVLITGATLGGAPAFVVGAVAALSSNLFFGQGYWTPWQMLAWGLVGLAGAGLGRLTRRRPGRFALAATGAVAGLGFGAIMNLSTWVAFSDHSAGAYLAMAGSALPFDIAHAVGNVLFALAFGPALLRAIARFRDRFEVSWRPAPAQLASAAAALVVAAALAAPSDAGAASSTAYLKRAQNSDGGWGAAPRQGSAQLYTGWTALGLAASGRNPLDVKRGGRTPISFIRRGVGGITDVGELERTILVLGAAGVNPRKFGGRDLIARLASYRRGDGSFAGQLVYSSFGVLALRAAGYGRGGPVRSAAKWIARRQNRDGGFNTFGRGGSELDATAAAVQALVAAGRGGKTRRRAVKFMRARQNRDGGFPLAPGAASNAQSTAFVAQAFTAAGINPDSVRRRGGRGALGYLRSLTTSNGAVRYSRSSTQTPVWVTAQAVLALSREPFPVGRVPRRRSASGGASAAAAATATAKAAARKRRARVAAARAAAATPAAATVMQSWAAGARSIGATMAVVLATVE